jgi:hypothetical protein
MKDNFNIKHEINTWHKSLLSFHNPSHSSGNIFPSSLLGISQLNGTGERSNFSLSTEFSSSLEFCNFSFESKGV